MSEQPAKNKGCFRTIPASGRLPIWTPQNVAKLSDAQSRALRQAPRPMRKAADAE